MTTMNNQELFKLRVKLMGLSEQLGRQSFQDGNGLLAEAVSKMMEVQSLLQKYAMQRKGEG
tara:strand:- start:5 stop:187 length:183 start_codon:yes stop_codon:yes gene_type:complete